MTRYPILADHPRVRRNPTPDVNSLRIATSFVELLKLYGWPLNELVETTVAASVVVPA